MKQCCEYMSRQIEHLSICDDPLGCPDAIIYYDPRIDEYGIISHKDHTYLHIHFCPWCGAKLPESKEDLWFAKLRGMGFTDVTLIITGDRTDIPKEFQTDEWYRKESHKDQDKVGG